MTNTIQDDQLEASKPIDWELSLKLVNNKADLAKDMLAMFVAELPEMLNKIEAGLKLEDREQLHQVIHKLHGGACYCGVPRIKRLSAIIEAQLKTESMETVTTLTNSLVDEMKAVQTAYQNDEYAK